MIPKKISLTYWGLLLITLFLIFFSIWASIAPIDSAAIAQGTVSLDSNAKTIQHFEGGIIEEILVKNGDRVEANQALITLSETAAKASLELLENQLRSSIAQEARLLAERDQKNSIRFSYPLLDTEQYPVAKKVIDGERQLFTSRQENMLNQINIMNNRIEQLKEQISGIESQSVATHKQLLLLQEEETSVKTLVQQGQETRPRLLELQRHIFSLQGQKGQFYSEMAQTKQAIGESQLQILTLKNNFLNEVIDELQTVRLNINDLKKRIIAAEDILNRLQILAPQSGIVTGLKYHTVGGVIAPGTEILTIIPQNDRLIIEAQLLPTDIDVVHPGQSAKIRLSAFKARTTPTLNGEVIYVSPDRFIDPSTGMPYYIVRVVIKESELKNLDHIELYPGMPAQVLIVSGARTFFKYFLDPLQQNFRRTFKEE